MGRLPRASRTSASLAASQRMAAPGMSPLLHTWRRIPAAYSSLTCWPSRALRSGVKASGGKASVRRRESVRNCILKLYEMWQARSGRVPHPFGCFCRMGGKRRRSINREFLTGSSGRAGFGIGRQPAEVQQHLRPPDHDHAEGEDKEDTGSLRCGQDLVEITTREQADGTLRKNSGKKGACSHHHHC